MLLIKAIVPLAAAATTVMAARTASAINCDDPTLPNPIYIIGSSAAKPYMAALGQALAGTTTIVYQAPGSCNGPDAIFNGTLMTGTASYWDSTGTLQTCNIDPVTGVTADVGTSDVFSTSCAGFGAPPAGVGDFFGPNQVMNFVVPSASSQTMISAQGAYFVYGFGMAGMVSPWNNDSFIFQRSSTSGTQSMIAAAIQVPSTKWKGAMNATSGAMLTSVTMSTNPGATIGILSSDVADVNRSTLKILAYQHFGQDCAWLPDSSSTAFDKKNVRDGHYPLWGPLHFFAKVGANNVPSNPKVATFLGYFSNPSSAPTGVNMVQVEIKAHTVPACAMSVARTTEVGPVTAATPTCGCFFDFTATGSTTCTACTSDASCTGSSTHCRYGYCEAN
jgi:hypothetical protein